MRNTSSLLKDDIFSRSKKTKSKKIRKMGINQVSGRRLRKLSEKIHEKKKEGFEDGDSGFLREEKEIRLGGRHF